MDETNKEQKPKRKMDIGVMRMMHTRGKTYAEIAEHFGTTEQVVKNKFSLTAKKEAEAEANKKPRGRPKGSKNKSTIAKEKMLTNWESSSVSPMMREDKAELNRAAGWFVTECLKLGQKTDKESIDSLYNSLAQYIALCTQSGMPMLVKTCHLALGISRHVFNGWKNGTTKSGDPRYKEFAELVDAVVGAGMEAAAAAGSIDRVLTIWWEKSHFNMIEGNGVENDTASPLGERLSGEDIIEKYKNLPD